MTRRWPSSPERRLSCSIISSSCSPRLRQPQTKEALAGKVPTGNTVLTVVATNVPLDKTQCSRLARMAATGLARHIIPAHMLFDGDIVFTLASKQPLPEGHGPWNELLLGALAADAVAGAVCRAARPGMLA